MREQVKQVLEWLHATFLFPLLIPVAYTLGDIRGEEYGTGLYLKCFLIAIPVIITSIATEKCKTLIMYLLASLLSVALTLGIAWWLQPSEYGLVYVIILGLECFFVVGKRFMDRLRTAKDRQEQDNDPFWEPRFSVLNKPSFGTLGYFVAIYLCGVCFMSKTVCDDAFFTAMIYIFIVIVHTFLVETKEYLKLNRQVSGLPSRRIYGITGGMLGFFLILVFMVALPSIILIPLRQYTDIRTWFSDEETLIADWETEVYKEEVQMNAEARLFFEGAMEEPEEPSLWMQLLFIGLCIFTVVIFIIMIVKEILKVFADFRETYDENGDKIELLDGEEEAVHIKRINDGEDDSETRNIRRKYRRMIRKHRKDRPAVYESPSEMEEKAGLSKNEEMQKLHVEYEAVRYGK